MSNRKIRRCRKERKLERREDGSRNRSVADGASADVKFADQVGGGDEAAEPEEAG